MAEMEPRLDAIKHNLINNVRAGYWLNDKLDASFSEVIGARQQNRQIMSAVINQLPPELAENQAFLVDVAEVLKSRINKTKFAQKFVEANGSAIWNKLKSLDPKIKKPESESRRKGLYFYFLRTGFVPDDPVEFHQNDFFIGLSLGSNDLEVLRIPREYENTENGHGARKNNLRYRSACGGFYSSGNYGNFSGSRFKYPLVASQDGQHEIDRHEFGHFASDIIRDLLAKKDLLHLTDDKIKMLKKEFISAAKSVIANPLNRALNEKLSASSLSLLDVFLEEARDELAATHFGDRALTDKLNSLLVEDTNTTISLYDYWSHFLDENGLFNNWLIRNSFNKPKAEYYRILKETVPLTNFIRESSRKTEDYALVSAIAFTRPIQNWRTDFKTLLPRHYALYEPANNMRKELSVLENRKMYFDSILTIKEYNFGSRNFDILPDGSTILEAKQKIRDRILHLKILHEQLLLSSSPDYIAEINKKFQSTKTELLGLLEDVSAVLGFNLDAEMEKMQSKSPIHRNQKQ